MPLTLFIKPATAGAIIRLPERAMRPLKAEGETVEDTLYWRRRLMQGDVIIATPETDSEATPSASTEPAAKTAPPAAAAPSRKSDPPLAQRSAPAELSTILAAANPAL